MRRPLKPLVWALAQWAVFFAFWCLLVGSFELTECIAGAAGAGVGTLGMHVVERQHLAKFLGHLRWLVQIWRLPKYVLRGTWEVLGVLAAQIFRRKPAPSLVLSVPYEPCGDDDASATERALAVAYTTTTPNFVVVGVDQDRHCMIYQA